MNSISTQPTGACIWLQQALATGAVESARIKTLAETAGVSPKALRTARERLGVVAKREGNGTTMRSIWSLPAAVSDVVSAETGRGHTANGDRVEGVRAPVVQAVYGPLWSSVLLGITQLTAPPRTMGHANMTVQALPPLVDAAIRDQLVDAVNASVAATAFAVPARNRWIAHLDHATALNPANSGITLGSSRQVREALASICDVLNVVSGHYNGTTNDFELGVTPGAEKLVALLRLVAGKP